MHTCDRCGVEFDTAGTWCLDCLDVEGTTDVWRLTGYQAQDPEVQAQKAQDIRDLWLNGLSDIDIAKALGVNPMTVLRWRKKLNLPATNHGGFHMMKPESQAAALARIPLMVQQSVEHRRNNPRGPQKRFWEGRAFSGNAH